jgi:hypothetical protein
VTCWRVRQCWLSRANPRSPRQRRDRWRALRVRAPISSSGAPGVPDRDVNAEAGSVVAGVGKRRQAGRGGLVERGQGVGSGGGQVVHRAWLDLRDPQREPVRGQHGLDVAAGGVRQAAADEALQLDRRWMELIERPGIDGPLGCSAPCTPWTRWRVNWPGTSDSAPLLTSSPMQPSSQIPRPLARRATAGPGRPAAAR